VWKTGTQTKLVESKNRESQKEKVKGEEGKRDPSLRRQNKERREVEKLSDLI